MVVEGGEVLGVADGEESGGDGLPAEFVQVEGEGVGGVEAGESVAVAVAEEEAAAVGGVDVEAGAVGGGEGGDGGEGVDESGVGGAGGGGDDEGAGQGVEGVGEGGGVEGAGGGGDDHGFGEAEEPGGAGQGVMGVGAADEREGGAVGFAGEEEGELVGFGAAGGDECVGHACLGGEGLCHEFSSSDAAGAWSQESREGLRADTARSAAVATARGGQCRWAAQGVGGVGGAFGEGADDGGEGVRVADFGEQVSDGVAYAGGDRFRSACGQWSSAGAGAGVEGVEDGREQGP